MRDSDLRPGERILYVARHHGLVLFWPILLSLVVVGIPWLIYRILVLKTDVWIITDRRLVDEVGILSKTVKESPFEKINNATYRQSFLGRIFNFGDVEIQTASEEGASNLTFVREPARVCRVLMEAVDADLENKAAPTA
jgi:uncharacterized membrane protein YdbT with pleckstrin-like domain